MTQGFSPQASFRGKILLRGVLPLLIFLCPSIPPISAAAQNAMRFRLASIGDPRKCGAACPQVIAAEGEIVNSTPDSLRAFLGVNLHGKNLHAIVFLHSPGGKVVAAMEIGKIFRQMGIAAVVARAGLGSARGLTQFTGGDCFSACVYALMGAKKRVIPAQSKVGLHRMFAYETDPDRSDSASDRRRRFDDGRMADALRRYSAMMGISPGLVAKAEHGPPDRLRILTPAEIAKWRLGSPKL
jgi:hypothetical protein